MKLMQCVAGLVAAVCLSGCATKITNLTATKHPRNANNIYPFEVQFKTTQKAIRKDTIKPYVLIGTELYPMQPAPMLKNRWEAQVPIPANTNLLYYRYKFDYLYDRIPTPGESSRLSPTYHLEISNR